VYESQVQLHVILIYVADPTVRLPLGRLRLRLRLQLRMQRAVPRATRYYQFPVRFPVRAVMLVPRPVCPLALFGAIRYPEAFGVQAELGMRVPSKIDVAG